MSSKIYLSIINDIRFLSNFNLAFSVHSTTPPRNLEGPLALNSKLNKAERLFENMIKGPESIVQLDGTLYTGLHGGLVVKIVDNALIPFVKFGKQCGKTSAARPV